MNVYEREAREALGLTKRLIDRFGPRLAGGEASLGAADALAAEATLVSDRSWTEDFAVHPGSFLGFIRILVVLFLLSLPALVFVPSLAAALTTLGITILVLGFFLYYAVLDPFYPKRMGRNVVAVLEPRGEVRRQIVVSGHHDSAHVFTFYVDRPELFSRRVNGGIGSFALLWIASIACAIAPIPRGGRIIAAAIFLLDFALVAPLWNFASREGTPGAGDNLAASAAALEIMRLFRSRRDAGTGLEGTRLVFASFDAEEAGLRGARAWARSRRAEFAALPTWNYNMDCLYRARDARFLTSDVNGSVPLSRKLAKACAEAAREAGVEAAVEPIAFLTGGTDAAELARRGVRATTLISMKWSNADRSAAYHTPADTMDAVEPASVELAIAVGARIVARLDRGELD